MKGNIYFVANSNDVSFGCEIRKNLETSTDESWSPPFIPVRSKTFKVNCIPFPVGCIYAIFTYQTWILWVPETSRKHPWKKGRNAPCSEATSIVRLSKHFQMLLLFQGRGNDLRCLTQQSTNPEESRYALRFREVTLYIPIFLGWDFFHPQCLNPREENLDS